MKNLEYAPIQEETCNLARLYDARNKLTDPELKVKSLKVLENIEQYLVGKCGLERPQYTEIFGNGAIYLIKIKQMLSFCINNNLESIFVDVFTLLPLSGYCNDFYRREAGKSMANDIFLEAFNAKNLNMTNIIVANAPNLSAKGEVIQSLVTVATDAGGRASAQLYAQLSEVVAHASAYISAKDDRVSKELWVDQVIDKDHTPEMVLRRSGEHPRAEEVADALAAKSSSPVPRSTEYSAVERRAPELDQKREWQQKEDDRVLGKRGNKDISK